MPISTQIRLLMLAICSLAMSVSAPVWGQDGSGRTPQGTLPETVVPSNQGTGGSDPSGGGSAVPGTDSLGPPQAGPGIPGSSVPGNRAFSDPNFDPAFDGSFDPNFDRTFDPNYGPNPSTGSNPLTNFSVDSLLGYGDQLDGGSRTPLNLLNDPSHRSVVNLQQLTERSPADMFDAIQQEVGVLVQRTQRGAAAPFIRGLTGQQVLIMVDGIRLNNATFRAGPNQYFNTIDPGMVERIEILRGPQTVLYGSDAIGGAINIVTRSATNRFGGKEGHGSWVNRYSSADNGYYTRGNIDATSDAVAIFGGGGYGNFNDLDRGGDLGRQDGTSYSQNSGDGKVEFLLDETSMLTIAFQHFVQEDVTRSDRLPSRLTIFDPQQRSLVYLRYQGIDFGDWFDRIMFTASYQRQREGVFDQRLNSNNIDRSEVDNYSFGLNLLMSSDLGPFGRVTYGIDMNYDTVDSIKNRFDATTGLFASQRTPTYPPDGIYTQTGAYGQWDVDLTPRLSGQTGVRYTHIYAAGSPTINVDDDNDPGTPPVPTPVRISPTYDNWSASGGLNYKVAPGLRAVGSVSQGFRAPNLDDLAATNDNVQQNASDIPSVDLLPEKSISYDIGFKAESDGLRGQVFYFWTDIDNMILRTPSDLVGGQTLFSRSNRDSRVNGLEIGGSIEAGACWELYGNMSYFLGEDLIRSEPLSRIPPTQGVLGARWHGQQGAFLDAFAWMSDRQDRLNFQDVSDSRIPDGGTPGFATFNIRMGKQLTPYQRISLNLENIFDKDYRVHGSGVDGPGFSAIVSYELSH